jgi:hypothetical protein
MKLSCSVQKNTKILSYVMPNYLAFGTILVLMVQNNTIMKNSNPDNRIKNPDEWKTGNEDMTGAQNSYLHTLADEAGEEVSDDLTKAEAAKKIEELQKKTGRGQ